jgi:hypothetical protein
MANFDEAYEKTMGAMGPCANNPRDPPPEPSSRVLETEVLWRGDVAAMARERNPKCRKN